MKRPNGRGLELKLDETICEVGEIQGVLVPAGRTFVATEGMVEQRGVFSLDSDLKAKRRSPVGRCHGIDPDSAPEDTAIWNRYARRAIGELLRHEPEPGLHFSIGHLRKRHLDLPADPLQQDGG